ncbi:uncharacterized protein ASPGLDRAFT_25314 [Aspergillus glaucus CBS 516.65]|uniref:Uncharacterized protein n=1 Tax=Aspergillus glaucus CBS 516.65 TaxID=1160497 RepID=A0A1L9VL67_ASPGL|nr:hypothetical protein ASPGLDRAFT_25314 [Aspergillus glaucus CBS 516.65]OJJ84635.1 hypothetical protein ASPGLDRAFT_25314 [Aspergillus glaucus CBS 516.65]
MYLIAYPKHRGPSNPSRAQKALQESQREYTAVRWPIKRPILGDAPCREQIFQQTSASIVYRNGHWPMSERPSWPKRVYDKEHDKVGIRDTVSKTKNVELHTTADSMFKVMRSCKRPPTREHSVAYAYRISKLKVKFLTGDLTAKNYMRDPEAFLNVDDEAKRDCEEVTGTMGANG